MASNFVLKLVANGSTVNGESQDGKYPNWIEVLSYGFFGSRAHAGGAGARRQGHPTYSNFVIRKRGDCASPLILKAFSQNEVCEVTLVLRKAGGEMEDYMSIFLTNALIVGYKQGNMEFGGESPEEEVEFSYATLRMVYDVQDQRTGITRGGIEHELSTIGPG